MEKSNLLTILRALDKKEAKELKKWLESPAHNQREDVLSLYNYLFSKRKLEKGKNLGKREAFKTVFPKDKTYDDAKMRQCMYFFLNSLEEFLVYRELLEDEMHAKTILAKVFRKRRLNKLFDKNFKAAQNLQDKSVEKNSQFYQQDYLLRSEKVMFEGTGSRSQNIDFQGLNDSLDKYYLADKLKQCTVLISHQTVYKKSYDLGLMNSILGFLESEPHYLEIPAIAMYYYALRCSLDRNEASHFENFKKQLIQNGNHFSLNEIRDLYLTAINYCISAFNSGKTEFWREAFDLYHSGFTQKILIVDGYISKFTFQNFVAIGARLKEYDLISKFLEDFQEFLDPAHRENVIHYSRSLLQFDQGNYDETMTLLNQVDYDDILMSLGGKSMLLRMYYELGYEDALYSLITSTKAYMQRNKVIGYHRTSYSNLLRYVNKLIKINPYDKDAKKKLLEQVAEENPLAAKEWLIEQIEKV